MTREMRAYLKLEIDKASRRRVAEQAKRAGRYGLRAKRSK